MTQDDSPDWGLIDRYLNGGCGEAESRLIESRRSSDPAFERAIETASLIRQTARNAAPEWDLDRVWQGVGRETSRAQDPIGLRTPRPARRRRPRVLVGHEATWRRLAAAALVIAAASGLWLVLAESRARGAWTGLGGADYTTTVGQRSSVTLADGSQIMLAPESHLHVNRDYGHETRAVTLEGEAAFVPIHDGKHPFMVRTAQAVTQDIGTTFEVSAYPGANATRVVVAEGRVNVRGVSLEAGQLALVERQGAPTVVRLARPDRYFAWRTGQLVFDSAPVPEVLAAIGRWYGVEVLVPDSALAARHVTAIYSNAPLNEVLTSLAATLDARLERHDRVVTLTALQRVESSP
jgi:transmembrane sensor